MKGAWRLGLLLLCCFTISCRAQNTPPFFESANYGFDIAEQSQPGTSVGRVTALDDEGDELTYRITSNTADSASFNISSSTGELFVRVPIDREALISDILRFMVSVSDQSETTTINVAVTVVDINDNRPRFDNLPRRLSVNENSNVGTSVYQARARDADLSRNGDILYSMLPNDTFSINPTSGDIIQEVPLDFDEEPRQYILTITAQDRALSNPLSNADTLTITLKDINDLFPRFDQDLYLVNIHENFTMGSSVVTVRAVDQDEGIDDAILYTISSGNLLINGTPSFAINESTGVISVNVPTLDREEHPTYTLTVTATEMNSNFFETTQVNISILDINDHIPMFDMQEYEVNVSESTQVNTSIITLIARDRDEGVHAMFQFTIVNVTAGDLPFSVTAETILNLGQADITLSESLDFETQTEYRFVVMATETLQGVPQSSYALVIVNVDNENDNEPYFVREEPTAEIPENSPENVVIGEVRALDDDAGDFGIVNFRLSGDDVDKPFDVNTTDGLGTIFTTQPLDFEVVESYILTVIAEDLADLPRTAESTINVTVLNINDHRPVFIGEGGVPIDTALRQVLEETQFPFPVLALQAFDRDGNLTELTFSIVSDSPPLGHFEIEDEVLNTNIVLDFDLNNAVRFYTLNISVNDSELLDYLTVNVELVDINDNTPIFTNDSYSFDVVEHAAEGTFVGEVEAVDMDSGTFGDIEYTLYGPDDIIGFFQVNDTTGEIYMRADIDREMVPGPLLFQVIASDLDRNISQRNTNNISVTITVLDINDNTPIFNEDRYMFSVPEGTTQLPDNFNVSASDSDLGYNGDVLYTITAGNEEGTFMLNPSDGVFTLNVSSILDFERTESYVLNVTAMDLGDPSNMAVVEVVIDIIDINDETPRFAAQDFNASIFENTPAGFSIITLNATDADSGELGRVMYNVSNIVGSQVPNGTFEIDPDSGIVSTVGYFDREVFAGPYIVTVLASDGGSPSRFNAATLDIFLLDTNDETPQFIQADVTESPDEEQEEGIVVGLFRASDGDEMDNDNSLITYSITSVSPIPPSPVLAREHFALNTSSAVIQLVTNASLDYESIEAYDITIRAQDNGTPSLYSDITVRVEVTDINDHAPQFVFDASMSRYVAEISENSPASLILQLVATDEDSTSNGQIMFLPSTGFPEPPFRIVGTDLLLTGSLDFESVGSYLFNVTAMDAGSNVMTDEALVQITILDLNDNSPIFSSNDYFGDVDEGDYALNSSFVALVNASDIDSEEFGNVSYQVFPANDLFSVSKLERGEGVVSVNGMLDRETLDQYSITILARDGATPPNTATATVTISVNDVNDNPPMLNQQQYSATIMEGEDPSAVADILAGLNIQATDEDLASNGEVYFFLTNTTDFDIDVNSGVVRSLREFDYELEQSFDLVVVVMDNTTAPLNDTAQLTIFIADINDNVPFFINFPSNVSYPEDIPIGYSIANIMADDIDSGINQQLVFQLANDEGRFSVDDEGQITLLDSLNREARGSYNLTVTVSDRGQQPLSTTGYLYIEVTDVNDEEPQLDRTSYAFVVPEDVDLNTTLGTLIAVDGDVDINGEVVFDIVSGDTDIFSLVTMQVDSAQTFSARIINNQLFDYENITSYSLRVMAMNVAPPHFPTMADITITIRDTNDNPPAFSMPEGFTLTVPEGAAIQRPVGTVVATDEDGGLNGTVNYVLAPNTEQSIVDTFSVNLGTGVITLLEPLDFEIRNLYRFYVEAFDLSAVPLTSNVSVTVNVEDTNENAPRFDMPSYSAELGENLPSGTLVTRVNATEPETGGDSVRYRLETGEISQFQIEEVTGIITTSAMLDRETMSSYVLTVEATDIGSNPDNPLSTFVQVFVEVLDVNDNSPDFGLTTAQQVNLPESSGVGVRLPEVFLATDEDIGTNANIRYSIVPDSFTVDENNGVISVQDPTVLDREVSPTVTLILTATDGGDNARAQTLTIVVNLDDINDNTPMFMPAEYTASVAEGSNVGVSVTMVNAEDADIEPALRYAIVSGDDVNRKFSIDEVTGLIETTANELDRETRATYVLTVSATDSGTPQRMSTATVTITVTDVNDFTPMCDRPNFAFSTEEANRLPIELGAVTASDGDNVPGLSPVGSGQLLYQLASTNPQVTVTPMGVIFGEPGLDFDTLADGTFTFAVVVSDRPADPSRLRSTTCRVTVTLTDENDNVPRFDESLYEATILEDATLGSVVTVVNAEDSDSGTNGEFIYSIRNSISVFSIDPLNGEVTLTGSLDSDIRNLYELDVEAIDNGVPSNVGVTILRISIADVDDISPRFDRSFYQEQLSEGTDPVATVTTLRATDPDSASITYSFSSGNDDGIFSIDDGVVQVTGSLDRETTPVYNLAVRATDDSGNFGTTLLRVDITDTNDVAPLFGQTEYNAFIAENSPEGTLVLPVLGELGGPSVRIQAIDADEPNSLNSVVRYSLSGPNAARFNIETSGRVTVARGAVLDFELEPVVAVNVVAMDSDPISPMSSTVVLYVRLIDVNDVVPRFTRPFGYVQVVDEDLEVGGIIAMVTANDEDSVGGTVRYRLTDAVPFSAITQFSVNRTNGQISLLEALDRETDSTITLIVTASDMGEPALSSAVNVQITVRDVNDNPPEFVQDIFTTTVPEFLALGGLALQVSAVDPDGPGVNSEVIYSLVGTQNTFTINPATGDITTIDSLDFESVQFHSFMVMACDRGSPVQCEVVPVRINVGDFNDQIPTFDQTNYVTDVCYDAAVSGTALVQPVAVDGDSGTNAVLSYSLLDNPSLFAINASTGRVWLAQEPTSADVESHTFTIMAQDMGDTPLSSSAQVMIRILNCTEQTFYFTTPFHYLEIVEGGSRFTDGSGSVAIDLSNFAQSVDFMPALSTNPFSRVLNNIQLKMFSDLLPDLRQAPRGLDREARSLYTVILRARDSRGIESFTSVTLGVLDANDNGPEFSSDLVVFQSAENQTAPLEIGSVVATDMDEGSNAELEYLILSVTPTSNIPIFSVDLNTGVISADRELDRETQDEYDITIQASDGVGTDTIAVRVTVQDVNDCPPMFVEEVYRVEINENVPQGSSVASVRATDCDDGANAVLRYSIAGGDVGAFELNLISGVITTSVPLDFEVTPSYSVTIEATDMGSPAPLTGTVEVIFTVVDFNDCPPEFVNVLPTPSMPVFEDTAVNSVIQRYTVQDCDSGLNGVNGTRFSIIEGNEESMFEINNVTGVLRTVASLDREETDMYILTIQAVDSAVNPLSSITELTVTVLDVNDNAPVLEEEEISISVPEGEDLGRTLITLTAEDADIGINGQIIYSLFGDDDTFVIDEATGDLSLAQSLDRETNDSYVLLVVAGDRSTQPLFSNATIINVAVLDENDNNPEILNIDSGVTRVQVPENSATGFEVYIVNTTDRDSGQNADVRLSLDDRSNSLPFELVGNVIRVNEATGTLDFEQRVIYSLVVVAEDRGTPNTRQSVATLIVEVTDTNDSPPVFIEDDYVGTQAEDTDVDTEILRVQATDADSNAANSMVAYFLDNSPDAAFFTIDNMTGDIYNAVILDREMRDSYSFGVRAENYLSGIPQTGTALVTINVEDINDESPMFGQRSYNAIILEGTPTNTLVFTVTASDNDLENTPNSDLIFSLDRVTNIPFFIEANSGNLTVQNELDFEAQRSYNFDVVVEDKGTIPRRDTATITITIVDVNDEAPVFSMPVYTATLLEGSPPRTILSLPFMDGDSLSQNIQSTLSITNVSPPAGASLFSVSNSAPGTGTLNVNGPVDYETTQAYTVTVMVLNNNLGVGETCSPQSSCSLSNTATVNVEIMDVNDNSPMFSRETYIGEISSTALTGTSILAVTATDADLSPAFSSIRYRLGSNSANAAFRIGETTGTIFTRGSFEGLDGDMYTLNVVAVDNNGNPPFNTATTTIDLIVLNDFQRIAIIFNTSVDIISGKEQRIVDTLERLTGYDIFVEQYREYSTDITTSFIFHAMGDGQIIDFDEFLTPSVENRLFVELEDCRIIRIQSFGDLIVTQGPVDTEIIVILVLCLFLIIGAIIVLIFAFSQRYLALHAARHKLLADVFYGSHAGSSIVENIHQENIQLQLLETSGQATNKQNPMFVHPYDNWAGVDTSGVESVGGDSNLQKDNPLYESQEIRMEMFADVSDEEEEDEADEAELLAAALQEDSDLEDEDNSVTAI